MKYCSVQKCRYPNTHTTHYHMCTKCKTYGHGVLECNDLHKKQLLFQEPQIVLPDLLHCTFGGCDTKMYHTTEAHHCDNCKERGHSKLTCSKLVKTQMCPDVNLICPECNQKVIKYRYFEGLPDKCIMCNTREINLFFTNCKHSCICSVCLPRIVTEDKINHIRSESVLQLFEYNISQIKKILTVFPAYCIVQEGMGCFSYIRQLTKESQLEGIFIHSDDIYDDIKIKENDNFINGYQLCESEVPIIHIPI